MRKASKMKGTPIYSLNRGKQLDTVNDVIFDHTDNLIIGFVTSNEGWFSNAEVLPWSNVKTIGPDGIITRHNEVIIEATERPVIDNILKNGNVLAGTKVMTTDGQNLGTIKDLYFDPVTGVIEGYEVSGGVYADVMTGRSFLPAPEVFDVGEDVAYVPPTVSDLMKEQIGGVQGQVNSLGESINSAVDSTKTAAIDVKDKVVENMQVTADTTGKKLTEIKDSVVENVQTTATAAGETISELSDSAQSGLTSSQESAKKTLATDIVEEAWGRRVQTPVYAGDTAAVYVAEHGQIVTEKVIQRAKTFDKEAELLESVGLGISGAAGKKVQRNANQMASDVQDAAVTVWDNVASAAETVKSKMMDAKGTAEDYVEKRRIDGALGLPVNRVILDKSDNVILDKGEIVTHEAVEKSRHAEKLEVLLSAVQSPDAATGTVPTYS